MRDYSRLATTAFARHRSAVTALVVGAGALGNEVIKNLALIGVSALWISDRDRVEASNLTRSILFCTSDIDREIARHTPKAEFAAKRVREINPDVAVTPLVGEIADLGYGVIRRADIVFSCVDNEMARLELGWACSRLRKTLVDGGLGLINYSSGQVTVFPKDLGPCYACRKGADRRRQLLYELQGHEDPCWRKEAGDGEPGVATTPLMASVVAAIQVELGLRSLQAAEPDAVGRAHRITLHPAPALESAVFGRSPTCPLHDPLSVVTTVRECVDARSDSWTPADLLRASGHPDGCVALDWPMTVKARCRTCRHEWEPLMRRARFRRERCPVCRGEDLVETGVIATVGRTSEWAARSLTALGFPSGHIYEVADAADTERVHVEVTGDLEPVRLANQ